MKRIALPVLIVATWVLAAGCGFAGPPEVDQRQGALVELETDEVPENLASCTDRFGEVSQWPAANSVYGISGYPEVLVLGSEGELACWARSGQVASRLDLAQLAGLQPLLGHTAAKPVADSNPLPAQPGGDSSNAGDVQGDSNPLPAQPGAGVSNTGDDQGDSNPLPAHNSDQRPDSRGSATSDSNPLPAQPSDEDALHHYRVTASVGARR